MKYVNNNDHVVNFSVAVNERWKNRNGDPQERTTWLRIVAFNGLGSACAEFLKRGDPVYVEGRLQIREYEDKDHNPRTSVEIVASSVAAHSTMREGVHSRYFWCALGRCSVKVECLPAR